MSNIRLSVDAIIDMGAGQVVLVERADERGWALPGGFVDDGETLEQALIREVREETGLEVEIVRQFHSYSDPKRDPRGHTITTAFVVRGQGKPRGGSDAKNAALYHEFNLPETIAFDHRQILSDYFLGRY